MFSHPLVCLHDEHDVCVDGEAQRLSPELGNVCFASALNSWCFTLESFSKVRSVAFAADTQCIPSLRQHYLFFC